MNDFQKNGGSWLLIVLLCMFVPFIGIPVLFYKLVLQELLGWPTSENKTSAPPRQTVDTRTYSSMHSTKEWAEEHQRRMAEQRLAQEQARRAKKGKAAETDGKKEAEPGSKRVKAGIFLSIIAGADIAGTFIKTLAGTGLASALGGALNGGAFIILVIGLLLWGFGASVRKKFRRRKNLLALLKGQKAVSFADLSKWSGVKESELLPALQELLEDGSLGAYARLDMPARMLILTSEGEELLRKMTEPPEVRQGETMEEGILREIRQTDIEIEDEEISAEIRRVESLTAKIFAYRKDHPESQASTQKFLDYYLPTTLKLLYVYAEMEHQGIEGENIHETKERIRSTVHTVADAFEKQIDRLYAGQKVDVTAEIKVMEQMLERDGLGQTYPVMEMEG